MIVCKTKMMITFCNKNAECDWSFEEEDLLLSPNGNIYKPNEMMSLFLSSSFFKLTSDRCLTNLANDILYFVDCVKFHFCGFVFFQ